MHTDIVKEKTVINFKIGANDVGYTKLEIKNWTGIWKIYIGNTAAVI